MDVGLAAAGVLSALLGLAHETLGVVWVLPIAREQKMRGTPFGSGGLTMATLSASWHLITVFVLGGSTVLLILAFDPGADARAVITRIFSLMWLTAAVVASSIGIRSVKRFRDVFRLPVPIFFVVVSILCWEASL